MAGLTLPIEINLLKRSSETSSIWEIFSNNTRAGEVKISLLSLDKERLGFKVSLDKPNPDLLRFLFNTISQSLLREPPYKPPVVIVEEQDIELFISLYKDITEIAYSLEYDQVDSVIVFHTLYEFKNLMNLPLLSHQKPIFNKLDRFFQTKNY